VVVGASALRSNPQGAARSHGLFTIPARSFDKLRTGPFGKLRAGPQAARRQQANGLLSPEAGRSSRHSVNRRPTPAVQRHRAATL
jgi:hypothetical protein